MHRYGLRSALLASVFSFAAAAALAQTPPAAQPAPATAPAPAARPSARVTVPPIAYRQRTLPNGMQVFTSRDTTSPNVSVQVWYRVGSRDDPRGRSGFAHMFEHMMFKSTRNMPAENMDRLTEDVGGFNNASTWDDFTNYYEVVPSNHLERLLWAESDRMTSLVLDDTNFRSERDVVKEELRQRVLAEPYGRLLNLLIPGESWTTHPYRRSTIGSIEELDAATLDDIRAFHQTYYRPDNAVLFVVGNFDEAQLNRWIDQYFGRLARPSTPIPRVRAVEPPRTGPRTVTAYAPNVPLPAVAITWQIPAASHRDAPALDVLDAILSTGQSSRLYQSLVYERQISAQIFSDADLRDQPGIFYVGSVMASGQTVETGETALRDLVGTIRDNGVTPAELAEAQTELVAAAVRERETIEGRADALGMALFIQGDAARANSYIGRLQAVTLADVQRVARTYLRDDRRVAIRYLAESARPAGAPDQTTNVVERNVPSTPYTGPVAALAPEGQRQAPPAVGAPREAALPRPVERTLSNGLRVIVAQSTQLPLVTAQLTFRSGAANDPANLAGAAAMTASLATQGTATRTAQQIASQSEALGAALESGSGFEASNVSVSVMSPNLAPAMEIMADVVRNPAFSAEELDRVRSETLDGLSVALQRPGSIASFAANPVLFAGSPYGHVPGGTPASLPRLTRNDLVAMHQRYWRPDNGILVLAGNITPEQGFALAERAFGGWARPSEPLPPQPATPTVGPPRAIAIDLPGTGQAAVVLLGPAISRADPRFYPGQVATTVLGGGYSARMNYEIRIRRGLSYGAGADLNTRRTFGSFTATAQTRNDAAPQVVALTQGELRRLAAEPPSVAELTARRSTLIGEFGRGVGQTSSLAGILSNLALYGVDLAEIQVYQARVEAVTPEQVQAFAREVFDPGRATVIVVGDGGQFITQLRQAIPNLEVIPAAQLNLDVPSLLGPAPAPAAAPPPPPAPAAR